MTETAIEILLSAPDPPQVEETIFSYSFCWRYLQEFAAPHAVARISNQEITTVGDVLTHTKAEILAILFDAELLVPPLVFQVLPAMLKQSSYDAIVPKFNQSREISQRAPLPFPYHNIRNLLEVSQWLWEQMGTVITTANARMEWPFFIVKRKALLSASPSEPLSETLAQWASRGRIAQAEGIFVHRFADYYASTREDLAAMIPEHARDILDVGCARGGLGKVLKNSRACRLVGVELNADLARSAAKNYDRIYNAPIESVSLDRRFDVVICGDVIEHLRDPAKVLKKLAAALKPDGYLIGSVPNVGHWSIVMDLLRGRFELIPVGLLCTTHLRFFTEKELSILLDHSGFVLERLEKDQPPPTPEGEQFIRTLVELNLGEEDSLRTAEFRFKARRRDRHDSNSDPGSIGRLN